MKKNTLFITEESELLEEHTNEQINLESDENILESKETTEFTSPTTSQTPSQTITTESGITLSEEQKTIIKLAKDGHNIFYTGSAGTGKSVLLRELIKVLKSQHGSDSVAVTASTGLAACNIGGTTVHSFAGIGLGKEDAERLVSKVYKSIRHRERWKNIKILVIDEISMIDSSLLDKLDYIAKKLRKNNFPFGGIQLIFCGDFFQLPPVKKTNDPTVKKAFESDLWNNAFNITVKLENVFRQKGDLEFISMLEKARLGKIDDETEKQFKQLDRMLDNDDIAPAQLFPTRKEVEIANISQLRILKGDIYAYTSIDGGSIKDPKMRQNLLENFMAPKVLPLKVGAQVMMIKNVDSTLVNGSLGKIVAFINQDVYAYFLKVILSEDSSIVSFLQKYQDNMDLLKLKVLSDPSDSDEATVRQKISKEMFCKPDSGAPQMDVDELFGSLFSTAKNLFPEYTLSQENLELVKKVFSNLCENTKHNKKFPLVLFKTSDLKDRLVLVSPEDWSIDDEKEKVLVSRVQLPLILAWALSIHKSQGQTIPKLQIDLKKYLK
ncbi:hypothetical protein TPHA_0B01750 [Tetrapisispora phaffii CBS 4417]|uniref:ATP-dependent DNA helicase n=1 Tax=Tetrapisispora phaffii (strain ATCC 24235 / CBS 4417 / NBRC 1672 / NRRL Y-8282 / UCD 70-5) TaxID=1071381 RepID=G8BPB7_TETPH|nr:hypothetical protein TPHA_0B01750 [Tetrapisispora phaffii CBS 4417]CCE61848.1 hypothetical protein TPHA_0B01750 [Tetrapisispora phaffii CBS 4417]